jgi:mono/diheme cytochrome c family protein
MRAFLLAAILSLPAVALADGQATYEKMCASCHGADGRGNEAKAKVLKLDLEKLNLGRAESAGHSRDQLREIVVKGKAKMPSYEKKLAPEAVDPVLDHSMKLAAAIRGGK